VCSCNDATWSWSESDRDCHGVSESFKLMGHPEPATAVALRLWQALPLAVSSLSDSGSRSCCTQAATGSGTTAIERLYKCHHPSPTRGVTVTGSGTVTSHSGCRSLAGYQWQSHFTVTEPDSASGSLKFRHCQWHSQHWYSDSEFASASEFMIITHTGKSNALDFEVSLNFELNLKFKKRQFELQLASGGLLVLNALPSPSESESLCVCTSKLELQVEST